jgi:hypothetical protein
MFKKHRETDYERKKQMVHLNIRITKTLLTAAMISLVLLAGYGLSRADNADVSMAVFFVG